MQSGEHYNRVRLGRKRHRGEPPDFALRWARFAEVPPRDEERAMAHGLHQMACQQAGDGGSIPRSLE